MAVTDRVRRRAGQVWTCPHCGGTGLRVSQEDRDKLRDQSERKRQRRIRDTADRAVNAQKQWTTPEMEMAVRTDMTITQIALQLGRSYAAVKHMRAACRRDPKYVQALGVPIATP